MQPLGKLYWMVHHYPNWTPHRSINVFNWAPSHVTCQNWSIFYGPIHTIKSNKPWFNQNRYIDYVMKEITYQIRHWMSLKIPLRGTEFFCCGRCLTPKFSILFWSKGKTHLFWWRFLKVSVELVKNNPFCNLFCSDKCLSCHLKKYSIKQDVGVYNRRALFWHVYL